MAKTKRYAKIFVSYQNYFLLVPMDWSRKMLKSCCGKRSSFIHVFLRLVGFVLIVGVSVGVVVHYFNLQVSGGKILSSVG